MKKENTADISETPQITSIEEEKQAIWSSPKIFQQKIYILADQTSSSIKEEQHAPATIDRTDTLIRMLTLSIS